MFTLLFVGLAIALAAPALHRLLGPRSAWCLAAWPALLFGLAVSQLASVAQGASLVERFEWAPSLNVGSVLVLDGLSLLFVLLVTGLGALVTIYAGGYLANHPAQGRFLGLLTAFSTSMLGLVLAGDFVTLFLFWEATSLCSYLLIGFEHQKAEARRSAQQALLVTGLGGLALLAGFLLLGQTVGSYELAAASRAAPAVAQSPLYLPILGLIAVAAFTKSAQVPFHFWLPNAMAGPTPVSAYLHSATMVKAGIYLLARMDPVLGGTDAWVGLLVGAGALTMLVGAVGAVLEKDLKRVLAQSTLAALGTMTALIGLSFDASIKAALVFLIVHALYKGALFMVVGNVDHGAGTRRVEQLGGLARKMPITAAAATLAGLSMAGLPPLFGFVGKELTYKAKLGWTGVEVVLPLIAVVTNGLTIAAAAILVLRPFYGRLREGRTTPHELPLAWWLGPSILAASGLVLGLVPGSARGLIGRAVQDVLGHSAPIHLASWYGLGPALYLSVGSLVFGVAVYALWQIRLRRSQGRSWRASPPRRASPFDNAYDSLVAGMLTAANWVTSHVSGGKLSRDLAWIFATATALVGAALLVELPVLPSGDWMPSWTTGALSLAVLSALVVVVRSRTRLVGLLALGGVGIGLSMLFLVAGGIDVAITQLLVETVFLISALLLFRHLPRRLSRVRPARRLGAAALASLSGVLITLLVLGVLEVPFDGRVAEALSQRSVPEGFGRNIVNVILVDFRALDTLGEITVVAIAALGLTVLLKRSRPKEATP